MRKLIFSFTVAISSFLLFALEPLIGKLLLPEFGGASIVWIVLICLFNILLLAGYIYAHFITKLKFKHQQYIHLAVLLLSLITIFFGYMYQASNWYNISDPFFRIFILTIVKIGFPFFVLSTTSILLQKWYQQKDETSEPYFLYRLSNLGALIGLLSYPFIIEPNLGLLAQQTAWKIVYLVICCLLIVILFKYRKVSSSDAVLVDKSTHNINRRSIFGWFSLSFSINFLLLSFTTFLTLNRAAAPLIWIVPLALYLLSYILGFTNLKKYQRDILAVCIFVATSVFALAQTSYFRNFDRNLIQLITSLSILFSAGILFNNKIYTTRPSIDKLTKYYLTTGFGGIAAALISSIVAPLLFKDFWEIPLSILLALVITMTIVMQTKTKKYLYKIFFITLFSITIILLYRTYSRKFLGHNFITFTERNFYGMASIEVTQDIDRYTIRTLYNGSIIHGFQEMSPSKQIEPTSYYARATGIGLLFKNQKQIFNTNPMSVGLVGLGVGTIAAYCETGDYFRFYEINPAIINIANNYFNYLQDCKLRGGKTDVIKGDARLNLKSEKANNQLQDFDILVVDAFYDDSIPIHLVTKEAIELYLEHLSTKGVLAFHISNYYYDLARVLAATGKELGLNSYVKKDEEANWFFLTRQVPGLDPLPFEKASMTNILKKAWTDDQSNILNVLIKF
jgi:hypothetical protein